MLALTIVLLAGPANASPTGGPGGRGPGGESLLALAAGIVEKVPGKDDGTVWQWWAEASGRLVELLRADGHLMAVVLPAGESELILDYRDGVATVGCGSSLVRLLAAGLFFATRRRAKRCSTKGAPTRPIVEWAVSARCRRGVEIDTSR